MQTHPLSGVYTAAVTPLTPQGAPDLEAIPGLLSFYAQRGCHGALLLGTTGEGPSFSPAERRAIWEATLDVRQEYPDFKLMAGTGTPSLAETIDLNQAAFDLGFEAVVTLPPFYFRAAPEEGIFNWFEQVIDTSVPDGRWLLGYHFPKVSGVALPKSLLQRLSDRFPARFGGLKDSSGDLAHAVGLTAALPGKAVLIGNDRLLAESLPAGGAGCITALANLVSPDLRNIYDAFQRGEDAPEAAARVAAARTILDDLQPFPSSVKALLAALYDLPLWPVRPPLLPFDSDAIQTAVAELKAILPDV